jgi:predicted nucleic acid-binding protein
VDRVFLDANVLFSAAFSPGSPLRRLRELAGAELWTSQYAAAEAIRNLQDPRPQCLVELHRLLSLLQVHEMGPSQAPLPDGIRIDEKDRPILAAAIEIRATHFLTGDKTHFGRYYGRTVGGVKVLTPAEYLKGPE